MRAAGASGGALAKAAGVAGPVALTVTGDGRWAQWRGTAVATARGTRVADLALAATSGRYTLSGAISMASG